MLDISLNKFHMKMILCIPIVDKYLRYIMVVYTGGKEPIKPVLGFRIQIM